MARYPMLISLIMAGASVGNSHAACQTSTGQGDPYHPISSDTISCNSNPPNPDPQGIDAAPGSTRVSITVLPGAAFGVTGASAIRLRDISTLTNGGLLATTANSAGVSLMGDNNTLTNTGTIQGGTGVQAVGNGNVVVNRGRITGLAGPGVLLTGGSNHLVNSGTIAGGAATAIQFGAGADSFVMESGTVSGAVDQGDGRNTIVVMGGTITGALRQGGMQDDFRMTGGQIQSLQQGDGKDGFFMSGGRIVGAFEDGDVATMTGGMIGRVDMKLDNNLFEMSGGTIQGNLVTGFGNDTIRLSDGVIGGNISVSGGTDALEITGGRVQGSVLMSTGNDTLLWNGNGTVLGRIDMGPDNDTATLSNLTVEQLATTTAFDGGTGADRLTLDNAQAAGVARFVNWETVVLQRNARLFMDGDLVLGDVGNAQGQLMVDATSLVKAVPGTAATIRPSGHDGLVTMTNAGTIDLTGAKATNQLTLVGNYIGQRGTLKVDAVLAGDGAAADRLVIAQGRISGQSQLSVNNFGGSGAPTLANGILLVQATDGATSDATAFNMPQSLKAGPYQYFLYKGGVSPGTGDNWYLRSTLPVVTNPEVPPPEQASGSPVVLPSPVVTRQQRASDAAIPIYRVEVPVYGAVVVSSRQLAITMLDTFHRRQGEQALRDPAETGDTRAWGRVFGESANQRYGGSTAPRFDGHIAGFQLGHDLFARLNNRRHQDRIGLLAGYAHARGDVHGFALARTGVLAGTLNIDGYSLGMYWTHIGPTLWYTDLVAMVTRLAVHMTSSDGVDRRTHGTTTSLSLEGGYPIALPLGMTVEPQAQFLAQSVTMDPIDDSAAHVEFRRSHAYVGRLGLRLKSTFGSPERLFGPYARANLWHEFGGHADTVYNGTSVLPTTFGATSLQLGMGASARWRERLTMYAELDYLTGIAGSYRRGWACNVGARVRW